MFEIGSSLRQARRHRRLELADVERATNIRVRFLEALEDDAFDVLPGPAYVRGFLRTYADFLGLDADLLVDEYNEHHAPADEELQPIRPQSIAPPRSLSRPAGYAAAALAAAAFLVWQLGFTSSDRGTVAAPPAAAPAAAAAPKPRVEPRTSPAPAPRTLVVRATSGPCWVSVHRGSDTGQTVYEGTLQPGGTLRFGLRHPLAVRLGAPWNARVTVRGKPVAGLPHRPVSLTAA